jgi:hypothetical protein
MACVTMVGFSKFPTSPCHHGRLLRLEEPIIQVITVSASETGGVLYKMWLLPADAQKQIWLVS